MNATRKLSELAANVEIDVRDGAKLEWNKQDEWQQQANGYRVTLKYQGRRYSLDFWQGTGISHEPTAQGVLSCLLSDAQAGENSFEDFCGDFGYDTDSRKAEKTWRACQRINERLKTLLGDDYETFLYAENDA